MTTKEHIAKLEGMLEILRSDRNQHIEAIAQLTELINSLSLKLIGLEMEDRKCKQ